MRTRKEIEKSDPNSHRYGSLIIELLLDIREILYLDHWDKVRKGK